LALESLGKSLGDQHPTTLNTVHKLASSLAKQGKAAEAEEVCTKILDVRKRTLGDQHPTTIEAAFSLAMQMDAQPARVAHAASLNIFFFFSVIAVFSGRALVLLPPRTSHDHSFFF
jgi:hypothetical protein